MPTLSHVINLIAQVRTYALERPSSFDLATPEQICAVYNGIGPEWLPKKLRNWLTESFGYFEAAAVIHDWEYRFSEDRSREAFTACNERLRSNSRRLLSKGCPWYKRWFYRRRPDLLADACQEFGWSAWQQA